MLWGKRKLQEEHPGIYEVWEYLQRVKGDVVMVGGAVRDILLGISPTDFDLASSLTPEELLQIAKKKNWHANTVGASFGVVILSAKSESLEVATFRKEGYAMDLHRPSWVEYGVSLEEDLARRDFTINGMALTWSGELVDPFGGKKDLEKKLIRTIGSPSLRFQEDPLRLLRAIRFAAKLDCTIEDQTLVEIGKNAYQIKRLAQERITQEVERILLLPQASRGIGWLENSGIAPCLFDGYWQGKDSWSRLLDKLPGTKVLRWAAIAWGLGKEAILFKGLDLLTQKQAIWIAEKAEEKWHGVDTLSSWSTSFASKKEFEKMLEELWQFRQALGDETVGACKDGTKVLLNRLPFFRSDLVIGGEEIVKVVGRGPQVAQVIMHLLTGVQQGNFKNEKISLLEAVDVWWREKRV